ncbi:MAG: Recombination protein terminal [Candidatus Parcubacteria bacterium]|jgi:recombinational DNA repair protein (RecF pathway)
MYEYRSTAIVLDAEPVGEADTRFSLFTERFGRIVVRGKSARKITSKLTPHLQIGDVASVRIVEKNGMRIADALKERRLPHAPSDLRALNHLIHDAERDNELWNTLTGAAYHWRVVLALLGWDPAHASCSQCAKRPCAFVIGTQEFVCAAHTPARTSMETNASKLEPGAVISMG